MNPLHELSAAGQSPWLDSVRRTLITSGELQRLIDDGITRSDLEPEHLRQGDRGLDRLRRGGRADRERRQGPRPARGVRDPRDRGHPDGRRRAPAALRRDRRARRVRSLRGRAPAGARHRRHDRGRPAPVGPARPPERVDQDPGHPRGPAGDRAVDRRRHQRERHAPVRRRGVRRGGGRLPARHRAPRRGRRRPVDTDRLRGLVLRLPRRLGRSTRGSPRTPRCAASAAVANAKLAYERFRERLLGRTLGAAGRAQAPASSGRCGRRPRRRTPPTPTRCTSTRSWAATP